VAEEDYLTEASLGRFLRERLDGDVIADSVVPDLRRRFRPDYRSERHRLVVEFDGDQHYRSAGHVLRDQERDVVLRAAGYSVVRIPYFVQLDATTIAQLFGSLVTDRSAFKRFPHGFIAEKVVMPADFCELGVQRFSADLQRFATVAEDIAESLRAAEARLGDWRLVYPLSLRGSALLTMKPSGEVP
jgi:hypothetical protein